MYSQRARSSERGFASGAPRADIESKSREQTPAHACHENDGARRPWRPCGSNPRDCQDRRRWTRRGKRQSRWTRAVCNERRFQQGRLQLGRATCGRAAVSSASRLQQGRLQQGLLRDAGLERATRSKPGAVSTRKEGTAEKAQRRSHSEEATAKKAQQRKGTAGKAQQRETRQRKAMRQRKATRQRRHANEGHAARKEGRHGEAHKHGEAHRSWMGRHRSKHLACQHQLCYVGISACVRDIYRVAALAGDSRPISCRRADSPLRVVLARAVGRSVQRSSVRKEFCPKRALSERSRVRKKPPVVDGERNGEEKMWLARPDQQDRAELAHDIFRSGALARSANNEKREAIWPRESSRRRQIADLDSSEPTVATICSFICRPSMASRSMSSKRARR